ncbi:ABC transporter substrate-binding protein [Pinisolibacter aquiterrae]|uniref:ABC transporter substrate-binding protein n=1 Tax=Pinisolibacter aquiterrae TaxID=2815579 RepID=UPI001C3C563D|nr:ABC transporter substrate-binding protein [Pinisolibacter aquiterrae]MBV5265899.1 ABC transporter substrate-binding protein [Pinisolibacter aquiterrae]MCC8236537.1 ABC transporter substrate-binding protein [Pinisolibacter aquiterrae]
MKLTTSALLGLAVGLMAPAVASAEPEALRIGVPTTRSGPYTLLGDQAVRAVEFAVGEANAAGGVDGRKVEFKVVDDEASPDAGRRAGEKLASEGYRILTATVSSSVGLAMSTQLNRWDAMYVSTINKSPKITGDSCHPRMFRTNHSDDMDIAIVGPWLKDQPQKTWGIIAADYLWGRGSGAAFKATAQSLGRKVETEVFPPVGTTDYAPYITQLRDGGVEGLWVALAGADAINFIKQAKQFGLTDKMLIFGHNVVSPSTAKAVAKEMVGIWGNMGYAAAIDTPANKAFVAAWKAKYGAEPTDYEGETYAGMQVIFAAVKTAKSVAPADVSKAMEGLSATTPFGQVTMRAADHQLEEPNYLGRVVEKDGAHVIVVERTFDAKTATPGPNPACKL